MHFSGIANTLCLVVLGFTRYHLEIGQYFISQALIPQPLSKLININIKTKYEHEINHKTSTDLKSIPR